MKQPSAPDQSSAAFFEEKYRVSDDPWEFASSAYEQSRYNRILHALNERSYRHAWEPGCSVGVLTERLAGICERVDACDFSASAVEQARRRCAHLSGVQVRCASMAGGAPFGKFDLIVLSEVGYYFTREAWEAIVFTMANAMKPGTTLLASHWLGSSTDHLLSGDDVQDLIRHPRLTQELCERHTDPQHGGFRLERWRRS